MNNYRCYATNPFALIVNLKTIKRISKVIQAPQIQGNRVGNEDEAQKYERGEHSKLSATRYEQAERVENCSEYNKQKTIDTKELQC